MHKAFIHYTNGTVHKLAVPLKNVSIEQFNNTIQSNINGYPELTVSRIIQWFER